MVQVGATWCPPCQVLKPMLIDAVIALGGKIELLYVDMDEHQEIAQMLRVNSVPQMFLVKNGALVDKFGGLPKSDAALNEFLNKAFNGKK